VEIKKNTKELKQSILLCQISKFANLGPIQHTHHQFGTIKCHNIIYHESLSKPNNLLTTKGESQRKTFYIVNQNSNME
jgi:hypothetical protein